MSEETALKSTGGHSTKFLTIFLRTNLDPWYLIMNDIIRS